MAKPALFYLLVIQNSWITYTWLIAKQIFHTNYLKIIKNIEFQKILFESNILF
jgi:hypothetical protein